MTSLLHRPFCSFVAASSRARVLCLVAVLVVLCDNAATAAIISITDIAPTSTIRHDANDADYQNLANAFPATGRINTPSSLGSGNFIGNFGGFGWVLTAGHVVDVGAAANQISFFVNSNTFVGAQLFFAPTYTNFNDSVGKGDDIALLRLSTQVLGVTPAALYSGNSELGQIGTYVGFGRTGTGVTGDVNGPGTKRAGNNMIDALGSSVSILFADQLMVDFDNPGDAGDSSLGNAVPLALEGLTAPGDSGGGLYANFSSGHELVGVTSFRAATDSTLNSDYGDLAGSTRVSTHFNWIQSTVSAVPEPSSIALAMMAIVMLLWRTGIPAAAQRRVMAVGRVRVGANRNNL